MIYYMRNHGSIMFNMDLYLVGGFHHLEQYSPMGRIIPYVMEKKKIQTTKQIWFNIGLGIMLG